MNIARYLVAAGLVAALGTLCLGASRLDREMSHAQQALLTSDYVAADAALSVVAGYYQYASSVPWVRQGPLSDVRARRAAIKYWQRQYAVLAPAGRTDPVADVAAENGPLQLIVADAVYREGQPRAKDRATSLATLESAINAYRTVLNNARRPEHASYSKEAALNYEYVVRLRDEVVKGRRRALPMPDDDGNLGLEGNSENAEFLPEFERYVPLEKEERELPAAGQFKTPGRKG